jgi:hypothetical protein
MSPESVTIKLSANQVAQLHRVIEVGILHIDELIRRAQIYGPPLTAKIQTKIWIAAWDRQIWACVLSGIEDKIYDHWSGWKIGSTQLHEVSMSPNQIRAVRIAIHVALGHIEEAFVDRLEKNVSDTLQRIASIIHLIVPGDTDGDGIDHEARGSASGG